MRLRPYVIRDSYAAQIEASAFFNLRIGYTCLGLATWPMLGLKRDQRWWQRLLPLLSLTLWSHTCQCDQIVVFRLKLLRRLIVAYQTEGDSRDCDTYYESGLYLFSRKSHRRRRLERSFA